MPVQDPYKVLGVSSTASEEEIKTAYRELVRKYHPDNYADSPLADLANEKMQEINEAYDAIIKRLRSGDTAGGQSAQYQSAYQGAGGYQGASSFADVRRMVQQGRVTDAEELLDGTPMQARDAEWYFLKGNVYFQRGWLDDALNHFSTACRLSPNNPEYRAAMNRMMWQRQGGFGSPGNGGYRMSGGQQMGGCSGCDMCSGLLCADCCCECMGGDLISCC
ncbi:MAG: DnaJ domain-containing protein [Oscillospiraceae bacterium]|nr:DnaJ domain-containing protein [Oscillospiraceae bacterium]